MVKKYAEAGIKVCWTGLIFPHFFFLPSIISETPAKTNCLNQEKLLTPVKQNLLGNPQFKSLRKRINCQIQKESKEFKQLEKVQSN